MPTKMIAASLCAALLLPAAAHAQDQTGRTPQQEYQRGYAATPMPNQAAVDARSHPQVQQLNAAANAASSASLASRAATQAAGQAQYDADRAAYMNALVRHNHAIRRTDARYRHQQDAYAAAMAAWRVQVADCRHGHRRACDRPAPNPANFY